MKKIICYILVLILLFTLCGCDKEIPDDNPNDREVSDNEHLEFKVGYLDLDIYEDNMLFYSSEGEFLIDSKNEWDEYAYIGWPNAGNINYEEEFFETKSLIVLKFITISEEEKSLDVTNVAYLNERFIVDTIGNWHKQIGDYPKGIAIIEIKKEDYGNVRSIKVRANGNLIFEESEKSIDYLIGYKEVYNIRKDYFNAKASNYIIDSFEKWNELIKNEPDFNRNKDQYNEEFFKTKTLVIGCFLFSSSGNTIVRIRDVIYENNEIVVNMNVCLGFLDSCAGSIIILEIQKEDYQEVNNVVFNKK